MKCKSCGAPFDETKETECPYCGAAVPRESSPAEPQPAATHCAQPAQQVQINISSWEEHPGVCKPKSNTEEVGLSVGAWIGGIIWVIIGLSLGIIPGILVIWLMVSAYNKKGFARSFLKWMNIFLIVCFCLLILVSCLAAIGEGVGKGVDVNVQDKEDDTTALEFADPSKTEKILLDAGATE